MQDSDPTTQRAEPTPTPVGTPKPALMSIDDALGLDAAAVNRLAAAHMNPGQIATLKLLGFDRVVIDQAEGMYYTDRSGRKILDFFGAFGALAFGHNHPRILAARLAPGDLDYVFLCLSGSEAVEAALKLAERAAGPERSTVCYVEQSFHGKTRGALSVTDSEFYRAGFRLLDHVHRVPFGDAAALEQAFRTDPSIGVFIAETIQGGATACSGSPTRCSAATAAPGGSSRSSTRTSCPTWSRWPSRSAGARPPSAPTSPAPRSS